MNIEKKLNSDSVTNVIADNRPADSLPAYELDDGLLTEEQLDAIRKLVPQLDFSAAESLFK
jgi:hypothetical protein